MSSLRVPASPSRLFLALIALIAIPVLTAVAPAQAATYQYWSYFHSGEGAWVMAMEGATRVPADGTVEGWRFVETSGDEMAPEPRVAPDFTALCAGVEAAAAQKRVALVVDYGTVVDERDTLSTCVSVPADADGFAVLQAATTIEAANGMLTCVQGIPSSSCEAVPDLIATTTGSVEPDSGISVTTVIYLTAAIVVAIAFLIRRFRKAS